MRDYKHCSAHTQEDAKAALKEGNLKAFTGGAVLVLTGMFLYGLLCFADELISGSYKQEAKAESFYTAIR